MADQITINVTENKQITVENVLGSLKITDAAPTTVGLYRLSDVGTYTNLGGLVTTAGKINDAYFDGTTWSLIATDLPQPIVNNYTNNNTYNLDPEQIVPSEALYNDETLAGDILKRVDITTGENVNYRETTTWHDGSVMNNSKVDGVIFIKKGSKFYKRQYEGFVNVKWFGAKGDGVTDDTSAFQNLFSFIQKINNKSFVIFIPEGRYVIKKGLNILSENAMPLIKGAGMRSTILDFTQNTDTFCLSVGAENLNTLNGQISDLKIEGNGSQDGILLNGTAPYSMAWCRFENLFIYNVNNGIKDSSTINFFSSHFRNIHIEKYFGIGIDIRGVYNTYSGIFIVQPSGNTSNENPYPNLGSLNLALFVRGANNTFTDVQVEDQIKIEGGHNTFNSIVQEYIMKAVGYGNSNYAVNISGLNTIINKWRIIGLKSNRIEYMMNIFGQNHTINNVLYESQNDPNQIIAYPPLPDENSSGVMINCIVKTTYKIDNMAFYNNTKNWAFINMESSNGGVFTRFPNSEMSLTTTQRNQITPYEGQRIFNTTYKTFQYYDGTTWKTLTAQ